MKTWAKSANSANLYKNYMGNNPSGEICIDDECYKCEGTFKYKEGQIFCNSKPISHIIRPNILIKIGPQAIEIKNEEEKNNNL